MAFEKIFNSLFKVHKGEGKKVLKFFVLAVLLQMGVTLFLALADALFLIHVGSEGIPIVFIIMPCIMLFAVPLLTWIVNKHGNLYVLYILFSFLCIIGILIAIGLLFYKSNWLFYFLKISAYSWFVLSYASYWNFISEYFSILDGKRLYPILVGGLTIGAIIGASLVFLLGEVVSSSILLFIWSGISVLSIAFLFWIHRNVTPLEEGLESYSFMEEVRSIVDYAKNKSSKFFYIIVIVFFMTILLTALCEYKYSVIFTDKYSNEKLVTLMGWLFAVSNIFNLIINFFIFNRLISNIGIINTILVQPITYLIAFTIFFLDNSLVAGMIGFFAYHGVLMSIDNNNWNILFNAFPKQFKNTVRTFVEAFIDPVAAAFAGVILLLLAPYLTQEQLSLFMLCCTIIFCFIVFILRGEYVNAMITTLKKGSLSFSENLSSFYPKMYSDSHDVQLFEKSLHEKNEYTFSFSFHVLWKYDNLRATNLFLSILEDSTLEEQDRVASIMTFIINNGNYIIIWHTLEWFEKVCPILSPSILQEFAKSGLLSSKSFHNFLTSKNIKERNVAILALYNSWDIDDTVLMYESIQKLLNSSKDEDVLAGIFILEKIKETKYIYRLLCYLDNKSTAVSNAAIKAISNLLDDSMDRAYPKILSTMHKLGSEERLDILRAFLRVHDSSIIRPLFILSDLFSPFERRRVLDITYNIGKQSIPILVSIFIDSSLPYRSRSLAARALGSISFVQFNLSFLDVIFHEMVRAYECLYASIKLSESSEQGCGVTVLSHFYQDMFNVIVDFILKCLTIDGQLPDFEMISGILRSPSVKDRSNAIETLEQGVSRNIFKLFLPLVDSRSIEEKLAFYWKYSQKKRLVHNFTPESQVIDIVNYALLSKDSLELVIALHAFYDLKGREALFKLKDQVLRTEIPECYKVFVALVNEDEDKRKPTLVEQLYFVLQSATLADLRISELRRLMKITKDIFIENDFLYKQGEKADSFYLLVEGEAFFVQEDLQKSPFTFKEDGQNDKSNETISTGNYLKDRFISQYEVLALKDCFIECYYSSHLYVNKGHLLEFKKSDLLDIARGLPHITFHFLKPGVIQ